MSTGRILRSTPKKRSIAPKSHDVLGPLSKNMIKENENRLLGRFYFIRLASESPKNYLRGLSHVYMTVELVALMTPMIAMGIQWLTALCPGPPFHSLWPVFWAMGYCFINADFQCSEIQTSCIVG